MALIPLKKYLDMVPGKPGESETIANELAAVLLESYRAALLAMGDSGVRACPGVGSDLQSALAELERRLAANLTAALIRETEARVEEQLQLWGGCSSEYFKTKTNEVKELLIVVARTAESMAQRDLRYADHFNQLTTHLKSIANLEDLGRCARRSCGKQLN